MLIKDRKKSLLEVGRLIVGGRQNGYLGPDSVRRLKFGESFPQIEGGFRPRPAVLLRPKNVGDFIGIKSRWFGEILDRHVHIAAGKVRKSEVHGRSGAGI